MATNRILDAIMGKQTQSSQAASTSIGRSIDSQQAAWDQALKEKPSTWNHEPIETPKKTNPLLSFTPEWQEQQAAKKAENEKPKKKSWFASLIEDANKKSEDNPWGYDATNNIIDTSVPAKPAETPKVEEPKAPEKKQLEYSDAFLKQEDQKDAWQPTWSNDQTIMDKEKVNDIERVIATASGAAKQYGSGMVNLLGTVATGLNEAGDALGGNTNPYAGFISDPLSESQIGYEHDPEFYEREKKFTDSVLATADSLSESAAADLEKAKDGLGFLGQAGVDIATNVIQMGFDATTAALTGGSSLLAMFLRSAGGKAQEARQEGATTAQQLLSGALSGGVEVFTEKIADGLAGIYGKGFADDVTEEFIRKLAKTDLGRTTLRLFSNAVSEGGEEVLSDLLNPLVEMVYNNKDLYSSYKDLSLSDILYDFFIGAAVGGLGGGTNIATGGNAEANAALAQTDAVENMLVESGIDAYTAEQVAPTVEKAMNGEELTQREKNILLEIRNREDVAAGSNETGNVLTETLEQSSISEEQKNAQAEAKAQADAEAEQRAQATAELRALEERASNARAEAERRASEEAEARQQAEETAAERAKATAEANATEEKAAEARAKAEARMTAEAEAKSAADAEARSREIANAERIAEIQQEIADLEQQPPSPERNDEILRLVEEQNQLTQESTEQLNIDNATETRYNPLTNNEVGDTNDTGRGTEENPGRVPGVLEESTADAEGRRGHSEVPVSSGLVLLSDDSLKTLESRGVVPVIVSETTTDNAAFSSALSDARESNPDNGWAVTPKSEQDLAESGARTFMNAEGTAGFAVAPDGDIEAVFANKSKGAPKGVTKSTIPTAIANGGVKLDCYGPGLVFLCEQYGFVPVARVTFNPEYANEGWTPDKGNPDIYFMMHNGDPADTVVQKIGTYRNSTQAELDALPLMEYDDAYNYRDSLLNQQNQSSESDTAESSQNASESQETSGNENVPTQSEENLKNNLEANTATEAGSGENNTQTGEEYNALGQKYGTMEPGEKAARDAAMPKQVSDDTRNSESARSVAESPNTPEERLPDIESATVEGKTSYVPITNAELAQEAESKIEKDGWEKSLRDWTAAVRSGQANARLVAEGAVLLNNAANNSSCTGAEYVDIMLDYIALNHALGRGLAANRILKTLSPEGRLYALQKIVQKMNNDAKESKKSQRQRAKQEKANQQAAEELVEEIRRDMSNLVFTFEYSDEAAQIVANAVARKANPKSNRSTPTSLEQLAKTIAKFAAERIQTKKNASNSMTATQILAELSNNEEFAREVYELAQQQTRNTPNADAFSNEAMNLADSRIVQRALAEAALDTNENNETIRNQAALGMSNEQIAQYLTDYLIKAVDASESMSNAIHDAALNYVNNVLNNDTKTEEARVNSLVNQIMNQIGEQFYNLAKSDSYTRDTARQAIIDTLTERYGIDGSSANAVADAIATDFDAKLQNAIQDQLQKRFGDKVKSDTAAAQTANKLTEAVNLGAFDSEYASRAINKLFGVNGEYTLDPDLVEEYRQQTTDEGRDAVLEKMQQDIADQVPATLKDKFTALRYLNMLGNLKTQARNILGNIGNMAMYKAKNTVRSAIESLLGTDKQYSAFYGADLRRVSSQYFDSNSDVQKEAMGSNKFASVAKQYKQEIEDKRRIFKSNILEGYRHLTDKMMNEIGDKIFVKATFTDALAGYLKAHDITAEQWNALVTEANGDPSSEAAGIVDEATQFAIKQAQEATFRDTNAVSKAFSEFDSNWPNLLKTLSQGVIPFRKTPANVLVRMEEFSPLGFANTAFKAIQKGMGSENVTGADIIDSFSKALTGSGLSVLGYFLAAAGKARTKSDDDKEEAYAKLMGLQDYSITIGGHNFTMDWLTPESASFFMGVELYNLLKDGTVPPEAAMRMLGNLTSPMLEMSMLSGLNDALDNIADYNGDTEALPQLVLNSAWGYLSQGITNTLLGQLEQGSEKYRQTYYTDPDNPFLSTSMQKMLAKAGNKTPGKDFQAADFIDAWGRKQENGDNILSRYFNALVNPSYVSNMDKKATAVDDELQRLYDYGKDIDGFPNVLPQQVKRSQTVNKTKLSPEEYDKYATIKGQKSLELVSDLIESSAYKRLSDDEKADAISEMYSYAKYLADSQIAKDRKESFKPATKRYENMEKAEKAGIDPVEFYGYYQKYKDVDNSKGSAQKHAEEFAVYIDKQNGLTSTQKNILKESFKFSGGFTANTDTYDKWRAAGLSPEDAQGFRDKIDSFGNSNGSISNAEVFAAIEQYATDADMAERLWKAAGTSTSKKKTYQQANSSTKFKGGYVSSGSSSSSGSTGNRLLDAISGSSGSSGTSSSTGNRLLDALGRG